jgi:hypothetical protein
LIEAANQKIADLEYGLRANVREVDQLKQMMEMLHKSIKELQKPQASNQGSSIVDENVIKNLLDRTTQLE